LAPHQATQGTRPCEQTHSYLAVADDKRGAWGHRKWQNWGCYETYRQKKLWGDLKRKQQRARQRPHAWAAMPGWHHPQAHRTHGTICIQATLDLAIQAMHQVSHAIQTHTCATRLSRSYALKCCTHPHTPPAVTSDAAAATRTHSTTCNGGCRYRGTSNP
jgi:hypothetical protein